MIIFGETKGSKNMWKQLSLTDFSQFESPRLQLHQAAQFLANTAEHFIEKRKDYSHSALTWVNSIKGVSTEALNRENYKLALSYRLLEIYLLDKNYDTIESLSLNGLTKSQIESWIILTLDKHNLNTANLIFKKLFDIPDNPQGNGEAFSLTNADVFAEIEHYYSNANLLLSKISEDYGSSFVYCWPHHFDMATLLQLDKEKSISLGFSAGDQSYSEPYFYVSPWPYPDSRNLELPELFHDAFWHTKHWVGAVFLAKDILQNPQEKKTIVEAFLTSSLHVCKQILY